MFKSLYARVILLFLAIVISMLSLGYYIIFHYYMSYFHEKVKVEMHRVAVSAVQLFQESQENEFEHTLGGLQLSRSYLLNIYRLEGSVPVLLIYPNMDRLDVDPAILKAVLNENREYFGPIRTGADPSDMTLSITCIPFEHQGGRYVMVLKQDFTNSVVLEFNIILLLLIIVLIGSVLLFLFSTKRLMRPLKEMVKAIGRVSKGDFEVKVNVRGSDEMGVLAAHFNRMAGELKKIERMRGEFVSNVSHEIQSPLTSINGFSKALKHGMIDTEEERMKVYTIIHEESERLSRLCDNLLKLASLESDHHPFLPKTYALDEQLRKVVIASEPVWSGKGITIDIQLEETVITADEDQLYQVWKNLLDNGIKFSPASGIVRIQLKRTSKEIVVRFMDSGPGIPPDELENIFERFYKADKSRNRKKEGNGLGLAIVKRIVELHYGTITVENNEDGGALFSVRLPVSPG